MTVNNVILINESPSLHVTKYAAGKLPRTLSRGLCQFSYWFKWGSTGWKLNLPSFSCELNTESL